MSGNSTDSPPRGASYFTQAVVALTVILLIAGLLLHGFSFEIHQRLWAHVFERFGGPMSFRFLLQPTMAAIAALHDGIRDARQGHKSFFWTAWFDRTQPTGRLREGLTSSARTLLMGISIDVIYQLKALDSFYPAEAAIIAVMLAVIPYFIFRWVVELVARRWFAHNGRAAQ